MAYTKEILTLAVEVGDAMLRCGAEIYRVEDSVIHILEAYDVENFDVYVLSNGIFASANENREDACSMVRHVPLGATDLGKVIMLNQLTRDICTHSCSLIDAWERLEACNKRQGYPGGVRLLACGVGCACFCYLFGGTLPDCGAALVVGAAEQMFLAFSARRKLSRFLKNVFASMLVAMLAIICIAVNIPVHYDKVIIGGIMPLVPGIVFTTSIRDFYNGDYLSGTIHLIDALLTAACIAVGVCIPIVVLRYLEGGIAL
ncbi:MAG: threonine/serine exporter family protein [Muribaculaceae bacterium]|nr:threonine/serine exporter family protein [Roseburia sp.]MCM1431471.1 threonine/serine exporter family protein [Muribaculaceae bacterium]MCM1493235.1 threonine/serine exporter family protein [Muribaculaceae bacterium]